MVLEEKMLAAPIENYNVGKDQDTMLSLLDLPHIGIPHDALL